MGGEAAGSGPSSATRAAASKPRHVDAPPVHVLTSLTWSVSEFVLTSASRGGAAPSTALEKLLLLRHPTIVAAGATPSAYGGQHTGGEEHTGNVLPCSGLRSAQPLVH